MTLSKKSIFYILITLIIGLPIFIIFLTTIIKNEINHKLSQVEINIPKMTRNDVLEAFGIKPGDKNIIKNRNKDRNKDRKTKSKKDNLMEDKFSTEQTTENFTKGPDLPHISKKERQLEEILRNIEATPQQKPISAEEEIAILETKTFDWNKYVSKEDKTKIRQILEGEIQSNNINNYISYPVNYGKTKFRNPADLTPEEYRAFKYGYPADMTLADYVNWLWMFREEDYSLTLDHATNLQKLKVGIKLEYVKGECPPETRIMPPLKSTDYFNKMYNNQGQLNIAPPLNSITDSMFGYNFADYVDFQQNMDLYGASGRIVNPELYKKKPAKLLEWWLRPVNDSTVNRNQHLIHEIMKRKNDTYFDPKYNGK